MHICTFRTFSPLPAHFFSLKSFMHFTRRCNKNCSMHTHTQRTINDLQIDDCIIQSASEVYYNVNDTSCLTLTAKIFNKQHTNDHVIHVEIAYILMLLMCFFVIFCHFFLNLTVCMCTVHAFVCAICRFRNANAHKHSKKWSEYELLNRNVQYYVKNYTCSNITSSALSLGFIILPRNRGRRNNEKK